MDYASNVQKLIFLFKLWNPSDSWTISFPICLILNGPVFYLFLLFQVLTYYLWLSEYQIFVVFVKHILEVNFRCSFGVQTYGPGLVYMPKVFFFLDCLDPTFYFDAWTAYVWELEIDNLWAADASVKCSTLLNICYRA